MMRYREKQRFEAAGKVAMQVMGGMRTHGAETVPQVTVTCGKTTQGDLCV